MTEPRHIYRCTFGSRLYGTELPESDYDTKGVFLPTADELLLCHPPKNWTDSSSENDNESYSLQRYLELLAQGQTVALDMLFAPPEQWKLQDPIWYDVQRAAPSILNKRCAAAIGYARAQAEKYSLRGSRITALEAVLAVLKAANPRAALQDALFAHGEQLRQLQYVKLGDSADDLGVPFLEVCGKKVGLTASVKHATQIFTNSLKDYGARAREAQQGGADWKALYHAVRICEQTVELLQTGLITFPRWNREDLLAIRKGAYAPERVYERIEKGIADIERAQGASELPDEPDRDLIDSIVRRVHREIIDGA